MTRARFGSVLMDVEKSYVQMTRYRAEQSLYEFMRQGWQYIDSSPFTPGWPIEAVAEHLQAVADGDLRRLIINIPPRCSKSSLTSVAFPAWVWAQQKISPTSGPGVQFLHASYAQSLSLRDSVKCRRLIESPWYQDRWGDRFTLTSYQNTKTRFDNNKNGSRLSTSVGSALTGEGGSCFPDGTKVSTPIGKINIEDLLPGMEVIAFDHSRGETVTSVVVAAQFMDSDDIYEIRTSKGNSLHCTGDHPIFIRECGYVPACELNFGHELIVDVKGQTDTVAAIRRIGGQKIRVHDIQVERFSNFFAEGILAHNCIIVDDPNAAQEAFSEATIQSTIDWWDNALSTRLNDPKTGAFIVIQQRLSEEDLTGHILSKAHGDWTHLCLPMRYEPERSFVTGIGWTDPRKEPGELLWPERFGEPEVDLLERQLGPWGSAGQLQQRPEPKGGGVIKRDWWQLWEHDNYPPVEYIVASLDTAYTTKTENDFSAMTVWGTFSGGDQKAIATRVMGKDGELISTVKRTYTEEHPKVFLLNAWQERLELHELVEKVLATMKQFKVDKILIENKAAGHSVAQEIRRLYGHEDFAVQLIDPKGQDKLARLHSVAHLFAEGLIYAPDRQYADMVITQCATFPRGKHDDLVDTVAMGMRHLRELGLLVRGTEWTAEIQSKMVHHGAAPGALYPV